MAINLEPNTYFGKLVDAGLGEIGENKTPAMVLTFEITHEASNGAWTEITEVRRDALLFLSEKAKEFAFNDLRTLGFNGDMDAPKFSEDLYRGTELLIEHEQYNGKTQEKLRITKLKRGSERKPVSKDLARTLAAQFRSASGMAARPAAPPPPRTGSAPAAPATQPAPAQAAADGSEPPF